MLGREAGKATTSLTDDPRSGEASQAGLENFFTIGNEKVHDKSAVLCIYNDNTGVLVEVVFVELVRCSGGSVRPGTLDSLRWLLWWESCTCGPTVHILILRRSSSVVKGGSESLKSKRSRS